MMYRSTFLMLDNGRRLGTDFDVPFWFLANWIEFIVGLPAGFLFFAVSYQLTDLVPVGGVSLLNVWDTLGRDASINHLFQVIDACGLDAAIIQRVVVLKWVSLLFAWFVGKCIWRSLSCRNVTVNGIARLSERTLAFLLLSFATSAYFLQTAPGSQFAGACVQRFAGFPAF